MSKWTPEYKKQYMREWQARNRERRKVYMQEWHEANADHSREYRKAHRPQLREATRKHTAAHPEVKAEMERRRRARKRNVVTENVSPAEILQRFGSTCYICNKDIEAEDLNLDHIIPISKGGPHVWENLRPTHASCNARKGNKVVTFFIKEGLLDEAAC